jgi:hypothetical protein
MPDRGWRSWSRKTAAGLALGAWGLAILFLFFRGLPAHLKPASQLFSTLGLALLSLYSMWFLGWRARMRFGARLEEQVGKLEVSLLEVTVGVSYVMGAMCLVGALGLYGRTAAWVVIGLPLAGNHRRFLADLWRRSGFAPRTRASGGADAALVAKLVILVVGVMTLLESLAPATSQDALVYHLAVPAKYVERGGLHFVEGNFFSAFPQNVEMLFTLGLLLDGDALAKWYHWMLGALAAVAVAALARRVALPGRSGSLPWLAAALFVTIPTAALIATWAYIDLGVVFFTTMSTIFFLHFWDRQLAARAEGRRDAWPFLLLAAGFAGIACGCKYTAGAQGLLLAATVLAVGRLRGLGWRLLALEAGAVCGVVLLLTAPWLLKNILTTGNPLYPFAYSLFGGRGWDAERAEILGRSLAEWGGNRAGLELLLLPWDVSLGGEFFSQKNFDGVIGCAFLIGAPVLVYGLRLGEKYRIAAFLFLLHGLLWACMTHQVRFLLPALALACALTAAAVGSLSGPWIRRVALAVLSVAMLGNVSLVARHFASHNPLPVVLGLESENRYLQREVPGGDYAVFRYIDERLPATSRILFGSCGNPGFLCKRPYYSDALFENHTLARFLREAGGAPELERRLLDAGFTHLLLRFDTVFDPRNVRSEIPVGDQQLLADFLNSCARLECQAGGTFLYAIGVEP